MNKVIYMEDVKLMRGGTFCNFSGNPTLYSRDGDRYFHILIEDQETADYLSNDLGLNVKPDKWLASRDPDAEPRWFIKIKVGFRFPTKIVMIQNGLQIELDENTCGQLDHMNFEHVDLGFRCSHWESPQGEGYTAYLDSIYATVEDDPLARKYGIAANLSPINDEEDLPF